MAAATIKQSLRDLYLIRIVQKLLELRGCSKYLITAFEFPEFESVLPTAPKPFVRRFGRTVWETSGFFVFRELLGMRQAASRTKSRPIFGGR